MSKRILIRRWDEKPANMEMKKDNRGTSVECLYKELIIFRGEKSVQFLYIERLHGVTPEGKHWFKFHNPRKLIYTVKQNSFGENVGRFYYKEGKSFTNIAQSVNMYLSRLTHATYMTVPVGADVFALLIREVAEENGIDIPLTASVFDKNFLYPCISHLYATSRLPTKITRWASTNDLGLFVKRAFGKSRYRKDLVKAVANLSCVGTFMLGYSFRGLVPIDWIIDFYRNNAGYAYEGFKVYDEDEYTLFRVLPEKQRHKLFKVLTVKDSFNQHRGGMWVHDLLSALESIKDTGYTEGLSEITFTNLKEAHDKLSVFARTARAIVDNEKIIQPLEKTFLAQEIEKLDQSKSSIQIRVAQKAIDLVNWGSEMGHCIGSYTDEAIKGHATFAGIYQHGKLVGNLQFNDSRKQLSQIFGQYNKYLDPDIMLRVFEILLETPNIQPGDLSGAWGASGITSNPRFKALRNTYKLDKMMFNDPNQGWTHVGYIDKENNDKFIPVANNINFDGPEIVDRAWNPAIVDRRIEYQFNFQADQLPFA